MMTITPEQRQTAVDAVAEHGSQKRAAAALGMAQSTLQGWLNKVLSPEQQAKADEFGIPYNQVRGGWFKDKGASFRFTVPQHDETHEDYVAAIKKTLSGKVGKSIPTPKPHGQKNLLTRYILADLHFGMMSWGEQTGQDYDLKIAEKHLLDATQSLLGATPNSETALILNVGDTFHANDSKNKTPGSGHLLDVDGRFPKIALATTKAIRRCIDMALVKHDKVEYVGIQGNHDPDQSHWLNIALMMHYEGNPRVKVHWNPAEWFCMKWGNNLITAHHGDKANFNSMALYISDTFRELRGQAYWTTCDTGHFHSEKREEIGGILFRRYRTLAAKDAYSAPRFTSRQTMTAITTHKERGEISENHHNIWPAK